jgi:hypothetical protein
MPTSSTDTAQPKAGEPRKQLTPKQVESTAESTEPYTSRHSQPEMADVLARFSVIKSIHPACELVPPISARDYDSLVASIDAAGQMDAILTDRNGALLDGRNRLRVCYILNIEPVVKVVDDDPWARAKANVARRHLTPGQLAIFAADLLVREKEPAAARKKSGLRQGKSAPASQKAGTRRGRATEIVAEEVGVSRSSVEQAAKLPPELKAEVKTGKMSLNAASRKARGTDGVAARPRTPRQEPPIRPAQGDGSIETRYESGTVTVLGHSGIDVEAIVYGPADGSWRLRLSNASKGSTHKTRDGAVKAAIEQLKALLVEKAPKAARPKRRPK